MKILIIGVNDFPFGGAAARCIHMLGKGMVILGHEVTVLVPMVRDSEITELDGMQVKCCNVVTEKLTPSKGKPFLRQGRFMLECIKHTFPTSPYDWIMIYGMNFVGGLMAPIWKMCRRKMFALQTDYFFRAVRFSPKEKLVAKIFEIIAFKSSFYFSSIFYVLSTPLEVLFRKMLPKKKIMRFYAPVDCELFFKGEAIQPLRKYRNNKNEKLIVFSGSLGGVEGEEILFKAFAKSFKEEKERKLRLIIASFNPPDNQLRRLERLMNELNIMKNVKIIKSLTLEEVVDLLNQADILVSPKIDHIVNRMAMPIKLGEYLATGKPLIATPVGDMGKILKHGENALLSEPGSVESLTKCINMLIRDSDLARRIGRQGKMLAKQEFDIVPNAEKILKGLFDAENGDHLDCH